MCGSGIGSLRNLQIFQPATGPVRNSDHPYGGLTRENTFGRRPWQKETPILEKSPSMRVYSEGYEDFLIVLEVGSIPNPTINVLNDSAVIEKDTNLSAPSFRFSRILLFLVSF